LIEKNNAMFRIASRAEKTGIPLQKPRGTPGIAAF
jgi:hypothetical protein